MQRTGLRSAVAGLATAAMLLSSCSRPNSDASDSAPADGGSKSVATPEVQSETEVASDEISSLLDARAVAMQQRDRRAFLATVDLSQRRFAARQRLLFRNLAQFPVRSFSYRVDPEQLDLHPFIPQFWEGPVIEDVRLKGPDASPVSNTIAMGFRQVSGRWLVTGLAEPGDAADISDIQSRPWGGGPIAVTRRNKLVVVVDQANADDGPVLADAVQREIPDVAATIRAKPRLNLLVDATSTGERGRVGGKKVVADAVAYSVYTIDLSGREAHVAGQRVKFDPRHADEHLDDRGLLRHELTHFLTKGTQEAPQWVEEGLAEYVRYHPTRPSGLVLPAETFDRLSDQQRSLPVTARFGADPESDYVLSHSAATYLIDTFGMAAYQRFRLSFTQGHGHPDAQTRKHLRKVYGLSPAELRQGMWNVFGEFHRG